VVVYLGHKYYRLGGMKRQWDQAEAGNENLDEIPVFAMLIFDEWRVER
jgi:hypothetical protein